jgi:signal transduction histidine kinase
MTLTKQVEYWDDELPSNCTISIVDDSEVDRVTYRRYLESARNLDWNIIDCESAEEALELCNRDCPDVILLDYLLPGMNGLELLQELTQQLRMLPIIIMLTRQGNEAVAVEAMKHGARNYLVKEQLTSQMLVNAVASALNERKLQAQVKRQKQQSELFARMVLQVSQSMQMAIAIQQAELISDLQATIKQQQLTEHQLRDRIIETEQINLRLSRSTHLLEDRNRELDDFSHIASHDLQAPLRGISNLVEWLVSDLEGKLSIENQQQLELIQSRVLQMNTLINGLLQYARVGRENINSIPVNLSQLLAEVIKMLDLPTEFQVQFPSNLPTIETQALLLKQVFSNLIGNAIKYRDRPNGKVEIIVEDRESYLQFTVVDDGIGIAPEHHKKIFGIFQTLVDREDLKGTGIGLTIVKKIVENRGGSIWLESELGKGSAFSFTWSKTI